MSPARERALAWPTGWVAGGALAALAWLWPRRLMLRGDDFGYVESVVAAIRHAWPAGSDWLEPYNLLLPLLGAGTYHITGSFYAATLGLLGVVAGVNLVLFWRWVRPALAPGPWGDLAGLALVLAPVALNKTVEFTAVPLGWTLTLAALLAWRARSPAWFFGLVIAGVLNRQSAVVLLVLPLIQAWAEGWGRRGADRSWVWGTGLAAGAVGAMVLIVPDNFARSLAGLRGAETTVAVRVLALLLGAGLMGGMAAGWSVLRGDAGLESWRARLARPWPALAWLAAGAGVMLAGGELHCETPALGRVAPVVVAGAFALAAAVPDALRRVAPPARIAALGYAALVAWRGHWWDYYLVEPALLLACVGAERRGDESPIRRWASRGAVVLLALIALAGMAALQRQLRWAEWQGLAYELAWRAGRVAVPEMSAAPFGYLGWKVFPAFVAQGADPRRRLSDFVGFIEAERSRRVGAEIEILPPPPARRSLHGPAAPWPLPAGYRPRRFPLDDAEWRDWLAASTP